MNNVGLEEIWPQIVCFYPFYNSDGANSTWVMLQDGQHLIDKRKTKTLLQAMARIFAADLTALRKKYSTFLGHKGLIPLPLHSNMILVPFRVRRVQYKDHGATGYVVLDQVDHVQPAAGMDADEVMSRIQMLGGAAFDCVEKASTIKKRLMEAYQVKKEYSRFHGGRRIITFPELVREGLRCEEDGRVVYHIHFHTGDLPSKPICSAVSMPYK